MARRSKYTPEIISAILSAIRQTGSDRAGWEAGGISETTYWQWLNDDDKPEFPELIFSSKEEYRSNVCPDELVRAANAAFADLLRGKAQQVTEIEEEFVAADGSVSVKRTTKRVRIPVPKWAIERVLGAPLSIDLVDALLVLADYKILPKFAIARTCARFKEMREGLADDLLNVLPAYPDVPAKPKGISKEFADELRYKILGLTPPAPPPGAEHN